MSLNIVDTLMDKLFFTLKGNENPLTRKFTASQNFLGNSRIYESIPSEFQQALFGNEYVPPSYCIQNQSLTEKMLPFLQFESPYQTLVNRVPKLNSSPLMFTQDLLPYHPSAIEKSLIPELFFDQGLTALQEAIEHQTSIFKTVFSVPGTLKKEMTADLIVKSACAAEITPKSAASMPQEENAAPKGVSTGKKYQKLDVATTEQKCQKLQVNSSSLSQELANRKTKEIRRRSKKRRRRQKKSPAETEKCTYSVKNNIKPEIQNKKTANSSLAHPSRDTADPHSTEKANCDILCDIVNFEGGAPSLQILLPDIRSFIIAVDSAGDDDSEWDNSDVEFIADCTEFEFSGLFVANLTPARNFPFTTCTSHVAVSPTHEDDPEARKHAALLRKVNKDWREANKDFCSNPKTTKVSFAPEDELVEVFEIEMYNRKGEWETYACERLRFKRRISEVESILSPCLSKEHREKVYLQRHKTDL